jgi:hypothetical protein
MTLLDQPYFSRTWIIPEILQSRRLTFLYGLRTCPAQELKAALGLMVRFGWKYDVQKLVKIKHILEMRDQIDLAGILSRFMTDFSTFLSALELLHDTDCLDIRDRIFAALSCPSLVANKRTSAPHPDYLLSRNELVVVVIAYLDRVQGNLQGIKELSRTLSRSLMLGNGANITDVYIYDVAASILSCTRPWSEHEPLFLKSGIEIGQPGPFLRYFLWKPLDKDVPG